MNCSERGTPPCVLCHARGSAKNIPDQETGMFFPLLSDALLIIKLL